MGWDLLQRPSKEKDSSSSHVNCTANIGGGGHGVGPSTNHKWQQVCWDDKSKEQNISDAKTLNALEFGV